MGLLSFPMAFSPTILGCLRFPRNKSCEPSKNKPGGLLPEGLLEKYFIYQVNESPWRAIRGYPKTLEGEEDWDGQQFFFLFGLFAQRYGNLK